MSKDENIVICRPDKGIGVVILDKEDYVNKMLTISMTELNSEGCQPQISYYTH